MKIVVVMSYWNRQAQLNRTLATMAQTEAKDVELVIVDDASDVRLTLPRGIPFPVHCLETEKRRKHWSYVAAVPFNRAIQVALDRGADVIVLQSPECLHVGDVLADVEGRACDGLYTSYACFSADRDMTEGLSKGLEYDWRWEASQPEQQKEIHSSYGSSGWFNHTTYCPCHLEFCAAIARKDMLALNGYDERFADGVACGDNDLVRRVRNLGLKCYIVDDPFVVHQYHRYGPDPYADEPRYLRNRDLFLRLEATDKGHRAMHIFTEDLK